MGTPNSLNQHIHLINSQGLLYVQAVDLYHAERIGHGYHVVDSDAAYKLCMDRGIHFECCPYSSLLTGAVSLKTRKQHPIVR